ncbi:hypothetical protein [Sphingomonas qomolangmaensis]|uniref:Uncharacterized protein n=1 Tax=Sphingomonas qomolangmaensis TaxID=2918765 RepID=A0ABY5L4L7_9SPHN|nr:hypothetical protein [Sphingomonas qomolangmaensis]UUL81895.1 hypothetical protein NMP03_11930 [Sphingomonas qomolangmaensis]
MGQGYNFEQLKAEMIARSSEQDWQQAKLEWDLEDVFRASEERDCLCGHNPIFQICTLRNQITQSTAEVGNVCVERFLGMRSKRIFSAIKRVRDDENRSLNKEAIEMFRKLRIISHSDATEYLVFYRRRKNVTDDQRELKRQVNAAVLAYVDRRAHRSVQAFRALGGRPATKGAPPAAI